ncbi:MAG: hypothetical protein ACRDVL_04330 [Acidimicrobiia bacterium]
MLDAMKKSDAVATLRRYAILAYGSFGTMIDMALMVLGSLFIGLSLTVLLVGLDLVSREQELSTGAMLISSMVLAVVGLFCLGIASEGPLGRGRRLVGFKLWEVGVGRAVAVFSTGLIAIFIYRFAAGLVNDVPDPIVTGVEGLRILGVTGMTAMPLVGVPLSLLARWQSSEQEWARLAEIPVMFVVWVIAVMISLG